jgi:Domain of unknown function (DUF4349)
MPLLDDETLDLLLHDLGDSFPVPPSGPGDLRRRIHRVDNERTGSSQSLSSAEDAVEDEDEDAVRPTAAPVPVPVPRRIGRTIRAHRALSVAASVVVLALALGAGAALVGNRTPTRQTASGLKVLHGAPSTGTKRAPGTNHGAQGSGSSAGSTTGTGSTAGSSEGLSSAANSPDFSISRPAAATPEKSAGSSSLSAPDNVKSFGTLPAGAVGQPAKIEQTGSLDLTVPRGSLDQSMAKLSALATTYDGFVANSQMHSGSAGDPPSGTVTLEVPVANFGVVLKATEALGQPSSVTTKATDVTSQYVDLQSRITALEASRQQYLTIMTKASSVGDVLAVQAQLDGLQSQIEQLQGQLALLDSETAYSTLIPSLTEPGPRHQHHVATPSASGALKAWHDSVHGFAAGVDGIIRIAGPTLFALLCLAALLLGGRLTWRRLQRHNL